MQMAEHGSYTSCITCMHACKYPWKTPGAEHLTFEEHSTHYTTTVWHLMFTVLPVYSAVWPESMQMGQTCGIRGNVPMHQLCPAQP